MLRFISLHAHAYKLMVFIVFVEVSGGQLTKYISGGKNLFNRLPDEQPHLFSEF